MNKFNLPDLGEGLAEAEIVAWHVKPGDTVNTGDPLVSVETAKAIVEIPSPRDGTIAQLYASASDIINVGSPLVGFVEKKEASTDNSSAKTDSGSVVGEVSRSDQVVVENAAEISTGGSGVKAVPAVRALARKMDVDLSMVTPSGPDGLITAGDVKRVADILARVGPMERLRGPRRAMARTMSQAHAEVVNVTVSDDVDINNWHPNTDITLRLIHAVIAGCEREPALNAWYDAHAMGRRIISHIDLGIALDTSDGLFVPVLRDVSNRNDSELRNALDKIKKDVHARTIPPEAMRGHTITLSNYGVFAGRYSNPIVAPPTVAILGAGRIREQVLAIAGKPAVRRVMPLSLTFDHRVITGGEATRFLKAAMQSLARPSV